MADTPIFGSVRRGYDPREVDTFLAEVAATIQTLEARAREAAAEASDTSPDTSSDASPETSPPEDPDARLAERFAKLLALQEQEVAALVEEAHREAVETRATAEREAGQIRSEALGEAKRSVEEARAFHDLSQDGADHIRSEALGRRDEINKDLPQIRQSLLGFLDDLERALASMNDPGNDLGKDLGNGPGDERPSTGAR